MIIFTLSLSLTVLIIAGIFFSNKVIYVGLANRDYVFNTAISDNEFTLEKYEKYVKQELSVESKYGYTLKGFSLRNNNKHSEKVIVFSHGVGTNCISSIKYAQLFLDDGWDVIIYDHRRHGNSLGKSTTYGFYEKDDLNSVITYVKNMYKSDIKIGLHGESLGSSIAIQYAGVYGDVDFYIFDCPFSDLAKQLTYRLKVEFKMVGFFIIPLTNLFVKLRAGFSFSDVSPIKYVTNIKQPTLFIHSKDDTYIPVQMTKDLYDKKIGEKSLYIAEKGDHARSVVENRDIYTKVVKDFLIKNNL